MTDADTTAWSRTASVPPLARGEVHVWRASVEEHRAREGQLRALLDAAERERAARYHLDGDRLRYVVAHGMLRSLLASYTGADPRALIFGASEFGKPVLGTSPGGRVAAHVGFNLSHAGDVVIVAVSRERGVGVDVERWDDRVALNMMAAPPFSPAECEALRTAAADVRVATFFACWTRKEAYLKATGHGLSRGLDHFDVDVVSDVATVVDRLATNSSPAWEVRDLRLGRGYSGAVVAEGKGWSMRRMTWSDPTE